ncbi:MAG: monofunctional biosynthetic peptidoglycan transglycosylase [Bacteroidales bacterium]|nr:monofunctional biosynthetic peptidoglycan transglycosylase [Bacteroidales bacterium]
MEKEYDIDSIETQDVVSSSERRPWWRRVWRVVWIAALSLVALCILLIFVYKWINPPLTPLMVQRFFQQVKDKEREVNFERDYVRIEDISPNLVTAVIASEDGRFMRHKGFDVGQLKQTYRENKRGRRIRGGSTISMQTAKNAFLPHKRSYLRKALEAGYTIAIEKVWGKERIMEVYLNIIEFGDGIYGCEAAAQHYFGHSAKTLSRREAAQLAVSLPAPLKRNPAKATPYFNRQTSVVMGRMAKYGHIDLKNKPKHRVKEDDETLWDFIKWVRKQKKAEKK